MVRRMGWSGRIQRRSRYPVMNEEAVKLVRGSGNVFADPGQAQADARQFKALLAAEIIAALNAGGLSVRKAQARTGIAAADFSRIRSGDLGRFTIDRLMNVLSKLDLRVDVQISVRPCEALAIGSPRL